MYLVLRCCATMENSEFSKLYIICDDNYQILVGGDGCQTKTAGDGYIRSFVL